MNYKSYINGDEVDIKMSISDYLTFVKLMSGNLVEPDLPMSTLDNIPSDGDIKNEVSRLLATLGVRTANYGFDYLHAAVMHRLDATYLSKLKATDIYSHVAALYKKEPSKIERAIRHECEYVYARGNKPLVEKVFGYVAGKKIVNREFISKVALYIRNS